MPVRRLLPLLVAAALPCAASAAAVVRGPFLQQTDATSTLVVVRTDVAAAVEVSAAAPGGTITARSEGRTDHVLRLAGLPPASATAYQVTVDGAAAKSGVVRTPGAPGTEAARHAVLGVIGDFGTGGPVEIANGNQLAARGVEAVLTVGDNAYPDGAAGDWDPMLFEPLAGLLAKTTFWPVPGDHEYKVPYAKGYTDAFELPSGPQGERYYAFDWGDLHVVALDSNCIVPLDAATMGCDAATMVAWLDDDLARSTASWKVVLIHRPALATGKYGVYPQIPAALFPILEARGVDLVLQGHNHLYERSWPARGGALAEKDYDHPTAPVYVTSGGGGDWLYDFVLPAAPWTAYREKTAQHLVLTLDGGTLRVESVRPDGKVHDQFELVKDVAPIAEPPPGTPPPPVLRSSRAAPRARARRDRSSASPPGSRACSSCAGRAACSVPRRMWRSIRLAVLAALVACGSYPSLPDGAPRDPVPPLDDLPVEDPGREGLPPPEWPPLQTGLEAAAIAFGADVAPIVLDPANERYQPGTARLHGTWYEVGLRQRGDGARFHPKLSWKTQLPSGVVVGGQRTRNFLAEYIDGGYLSDPFSYGLMMGAGVRSPRARFVTLEVNGAHQGVYVDVQQVDRHFLRERGLDEDANVYRCGARDCELKVAPPASYQYPWEKKTNEAEPWDDLWQLLRELAATPEHEFPAWVEQTFDLDRLVRLYAVAILVSWSGIDDSGSYLVHDRMSGKWTFVPWDLNNARLVFWRGNEFSWGPEVRYAIPTYTLYDPATIAVAKGKSERYGVEAHPPFVVLFQRIWDVPALRNRILDEVEVMLDGVFSTEQAFARIDALAALVRDELPRDPWVDPVQAAQAPDFLKLYVDGRREFLRAQIPLERRRGEGGLVVNAVSAGAVELYNREDAPRSLAGLTLTSNLRDRAQTPLPDAAIPAHGKLTLPFPISDAGGEVGLFDATTLMPVDVAFYAPLAGRTYARTPDGAETWNWR